MWETPCWLQHCSAKSVIYLFVMVWIIGQFLFKCRYSTILWFFSQKHFEFWLTLCCVYFSDDRWNVFVLVASVQVVSLYHRATHHLHPHWPTLLPRHCRAQDRLNKEDNFQQRACRFERPVILIGWCHLAFYWTVNKPVLTSNLTGWTLNNYINTNDLIDQTMKQYVVESDLIGCIEVEISNLIGWDIFWENTCKVKQHI